MQEPTAANRTSSRSHAVLQVTVRQKNRVKNIMQEVRVGRLFMIDLAGSERASQVGEALDWSMHTSGIAGGWEEVVRSADSRAERREGHFSVLKHEASPVVELKVQRRGLNVIKSNTNDFLSCCH